MVVSANSPSRGLPPVQRLGSANLDRNIPSPNGRRDPATPARIVRSTRTPPTGNHMLLLDTSEPLPAPTAAASPPQHRAAALPPPPSVVAPIPSEIVEDDVMVTPIPSLYAPGSSARRGSDVYDDSDFDSDDSSSSTVGQSPTAPPPVAGAATPPPLPRAEGVGGGGGGGPACGGESPVATALTTSSLLGVGGTASEVRRSISKRPPLYLRVEKKERIGRGSFGDVYRAVDPENGQEVAIKEIVVAQDSARDLEKQMHTLEREVRVMQKLDHPNTVKYLGAKRINDSLNIYMEYVNGGTIASLLRTQGMLSEDDARRYTKQLLLGLEYLHDKRIAHRDLKGDNLFLTKTDTLKVGDFGTSKELQTLRVTDSVTGTPNFMAPEVIACSGHSFQADIWSVGCCVIQMVAGKPPFSTMDNHMAVMFAVMKGQIEAQIPKTVSPSLRDFLSKCVCMEASHRWTTKQLLLHPWILGTSATTEAPPSPPPPPAEPPSPQPVPPPAERLPTPPSSSKPKSASRPTSTEANAQPRPVVVPMPKRATPVEPVLQARRTSPTPVVRTSPPPSAENKSKARTPFVAKFPRKTNSDTTATTK